MPGRAQKKIQRKGATYVSTMIWDQDGGKTTDLSPSSNAQRDELRELLNKMAEKNIPYRQEGPIYNGYTIIEDKSKKYRIDSQIPVNLNKEQPLLNLHFQIGTKSHAMVLVRMKPTSAPTDDLKKKLIDNDKEGDIDYFGFSSKAVLGFIDNAMNYSSENQCYTFVEWKIEQTKKILLAGECYPEGSDAYGADIEEVNVVEEDTSLEAAGGKD